MMPLAIAVATSLGVGYVPVAPGTFGSLAGLALWPIGREIIAVDEAERLRFSPRSFAPR